MFTDVFFISLKCLTFFDMSFTNFIRNNDKDYNSSTIPFWNDSVNILVNI